MPPFTATMPYPSVKEGWARGRFDTVPGDEADFIPLPAKRDAPRRVTGGVFYP